MSSILKSLLPALALGLAAVGPALALDDTPANRAAQADYYISTTPPKAMFDDMADKMAATMPEDQRAGFKQLMTKHLDIDALTKAMRGALIEAFTADELKALGDFYGSPVGKSAMSKFGVYMAKMMPVIQGEIGKAFQASRRDMAPK